MDRQEVLKCYKAIVHGIPEEQEGTIDLPIGKDPEHAARRAVLESGYPSVTRYQVLERFAAGPGQGSVPGYALLGLTLETGRTHQIRVHLSHKAGCGRDGFMVRSWPYTGERLMVRAPAFELDLTQSSTGNRSAFGIAARDIEACLRGLKQGGADMSWGRIALVFVGSMIGAGFVSGKEAWRFRRIRRSGSSRHRRGSATYAFWAASDDHTPIV